MSEAEKREQEWRDLTARLIIEWQNRAIRHYRNAATTNNEQERLDHLGQGGQAATCASEAKAVYDELAINQQEQP